MAAAAAVASPVLSRHQQSALPRRAWAPFVLYVVEESAGLAGPGGVSRPAEPGGALRLPGPGGASRSSGPAGRAGTGGTARPAGLAGTAEPEEPEGPEGQSGPVRLEGTEGPVDIPALWAYGVNANDVSEDGHGEPVPETKCTQDNVYNLWPLAAVDPPVQRTTDFVQLLDYSADMAGDIHALDFASFAHRNLRELRRQGRYSVDLFEVVAVLHARQTTAIELYERHDRVFYADKILVATAYRDFSRGVLTTAVGSIADNVPALPVFYRELPLLEPNDDINSAEAMVDYAKVGGPFLVDFGSVDRGRR